VIEDPPRKRPAAARIHCHLCGATLRGVDQFRELLRPDERAAVHVCLDEARCDARAAFDPVTGLCRAGLLFPAPR
jgi:hypothetical protein